MAVAVAALAVAVAVAVCLWLGVPVAALGVAVLTSLPLKVSFEREMQVPRAKSSCQRLSPVFARKRGEKRMGSVGSVARGPRGVHG